MVGVPLLPFVQRRAEFVDAALVLHEPDFGVRDVVGETIDLVECGHLLVPATTAQLRERSELLEPFFGASEAGPGCLKFPLG